MISAAIASSAGGSEGHRPSELIAFFGRSRPKRDIRGGCTSPKPTTMFAPLFGREGDVDLLIDTQVQRKRQRVAVTRGPGRRCAHHRRAGGQLQVYGHRRSVGAGLLLDAQAIMPAALVA